MLQMNSLNGWQRLGIIVVVIYLVCISFFAITTKPWRTLSDKMIYSIVKRIEDKKSDNIETPPDKIRDITTDPNTDLSFLPDQSSDVSRKKFNRLEKILESIVWKQGANLQEEVYICIKKLNLNPVDSANVLRFAQLLNNHPESMQPGHKISIPADVYWEWMKEQNPVTVRYFSDHEKIIGLSDILEDQSILVNNYVNNPNNKLEASLIYVASIVLVIIIYAVLPIAVLYYGGRVIVKIVRWIAAGFSKNAV